MQFILYKLQSADNVINKTITEPLTMEINLRRGVDIIAPVLRIEYAAGDSPNKYNYCHIPDLARFYFIRDIQSVTRNIWELHLECDVLESYKAEILASEGNYRRKVKAGDYGDLTLSETGRTEALTHSSTVTLEPDNKAILSVMGGYYG